MTDDRANMGLMDSVLGNVYDKLLSSLAEIYIRPGLVLVSCDQYSIYVRCKYIILG